jgi:hypothetical protein
VTEGDAGRLLAARLGEHEQPLHVAIDSLPSSSENPTHATRVYAGFESDANPPVAEWNLHHAPWRVPAASPADV